MSSNYLFTYTKTDIAFITSELCKLHKRDASYLCIFADVIYMNMRIETFSMEELREMEADNWTLTKKVSEFLQK